MDLIRGSLDTEEDEFGNPGDEERRESHGVTPTARLNLEFPVNEVLQLNLAFIYGDYDFGEVRATRFGFKYSP